MTRKAFTLCVVATVASIAAVAQANAKMADQDRDAVIVEVVGEHRPVRTIFDQLRDSAPHSVFDQLGDRAP